MSSKRLFGSLGPRIAIEQLEYVALRMAAAERPRTGASSSSACRYSPRRCASTAWHTGIATSRTTAEVLAAPAPNSSMDRSIASAAEWRPVAARMDWSSRRRLPH